MSLAKRFSLSYVWQLIGNISGMVMMLLGSIIVVRLLGGEKYGSYAVVLSIIYIVKLVIAFGHEMTINTYLPQFLVKGQKDQIAILLRHIIKRRLQYFFLTALVIFFGAPLIARGFQIPGLAFLIRLGILIVGLEYFTAVFRNIFTAKVHIRGVIKLGIITQSINLLLIYLFLSAGYGIPGLLWATIIPDAISLAVLYYISKEYLQRSSSLEEVATLNLKPMQSYSRSIWLQSILSYLLGKQADITLMGLFKTSLTSVGCYNIAFELNTRIGFLVSGTGSLVLSSISESHSTSQMSGIKSSWIKLYKVVLIAVLPLMVFMVVNFKEIVTILYTTEMSDSTYMFYFFVFASAFSVISGGSLCIDSLYVLNKQNTVLKVLLFSGLLNLILDLILIPRLAALGAVLATSISTLAKTIMIMVVFWRSVGFFYPFGFILRLILGLALSVIPTYFMGAERIRDLALEVLVFVFCAIFVFRLLSLFSEQEKAYLAEINPLLGKLIKYF